MKKSIVSSVFLAVCIFFTVVHAQLKSEIIDKVAAVVNGKPVTESEVNVRFDMIKKAKTQAKALNKSRVLDQLINEAIIEQVAEEEAIQVTETRIDNDINEMMKNQNITDRAAFFKRIEIEQGITYEMLRLQIKQKNLTDQVMNYSISFTPPTKKEIRDWYDKNKGKPDFIQMNLKHILIRPKSRSFSDEKEASEKIKSIIQRINKGASFEEIARRESQDPISAQKGGDLGWMILAEMDPYFASSVYQYYKQGSLSGVIKSSFGYHVVKFLGKRVVSFEEMENRIGNMMAMQKRSEQFSKWIDDKRRGADIAIYMAGYEKAKEDNEKGSGSSRR